MKKTGKKLTSILGVLVLGLLIINISQAEENIKNTTSGGIKAGIKKGPIGQVKNTKIDGKVVILKDGTIGVTGLEDLNGQDWGETIACAVGGIACRDATVRTSSTMGCLTGQVQEDGTPERGETDCLTTTEYTCTFDQTTCECSCTSTATITCGSCN